MGSFEVTGFSWVEELRARLVQPRVWPLNVAWLPAGATGADVAAGRVRLDARVEGPWPRSWPEIEKQLWQLDRFMTNAVEAKRAGVRLREEFWEYLRGVHQAAAWTLGVSEEMPLEAGRGRVSDDAIVRLVLRARVWMQSPEMPWDAEGASAWLGWIDGALDPPGYTNPFED